MGYKLAGYDVVGNVEIDKDMEQIYVKNHHPKYTYNMDIRKFNQLREYPEDLKNLDILDGSPPCSVFSIAGKREKGWNIEKVFREGQNKQRLDDLFFHFIETAEKLKPKIVVTENVTGLIKGNAKGYVNEIIKGFKGAGYQVQIFLLNAATMGVPQKRERVFFICYRTDLNFPKLKLSFHEKPIKFGEIRSEHGIMPKYGFMNINRLKKRIKTDKCIADITAREEGKESGYNLPILHDDSIAGTVTAVGTFYRYCDGLKATSEDYINMQTFPQDYDFMGQKVKYICGMSVPPVMEAQIATQIYEQWLKT